MSSAGTQRSHVALLRGVNVGGHNRVSMPQLRDVFAQCGFTDVATHLQSGNVIFCCVRRVSSRALATQISEALASSLGLHVGVIVKSRDEFLAAVASNPYAHVIEPRYVHMVLFDEQVDDALRARVAEDAETTRALGYADEARMIGDALFVFTPEGFARSPLVKALSLGGRAGPLSRGTARNVSSANAIRALLAG